MKGYTIETLQPILEMLQGRNLNSFTLQILYQYLR